LTRVETLHYLYSINKASIGLAAARNAPNITHAANQSVSHVQQQSAADISTRVGTHQYMNSIIEAAIGLAAAP
jgi:hypothetical protein